MEWMAWTPVTAAFFGGIALLLVGMTVWEIRSPCAERRGFLPIATTRGDRLFIGLRFQTLFKKSVEASTSASRRNLVAHTRLSSP